MNKNFERYYSPAEIDPHGVDLVHPTTDKILETYPTYEMARAARDAVSAENAAKNAQYIAENRKRAAVLDENRKRDALHQLPVPEMPKKPRLSAVPMLSYRLVPIPD